ncbi:MAG TPA: hypothetical protein VF026_00865, partial [Ktedonobacteraceae bacterium]
ISYRLRLSERPTNPGRLWHGRVEKLYTEACLVRLTEPGYDGEHDMVFFSQIVSIEGEPSNELPTR